VFKSVFWTNNNKGCKERKTRQLDFEMPKIRILSINKLPQNPCYVKMKDKKDVLEEGLIDDIDDIYSDTTREELLENDELDPYEAAFMAGYNAAG
jgi:hypothetical protein